MGTIERVVSAIERPRVPSAFDGALKFGDPDQIRILQVMNGNEPYCSECFRPLQAGIVDDIGERCPRCGGLLVPGAGMEAHWRHSRAGLMPSDV